MVQPSTPGVILTVLDNECPPPNALAPYVWFNFRANNAVVSPEVLLRLSSDKPIATRGNQCVIEAEIPKLSEDLLATVPSYLPGQKNTFYTYLFRCGTVDNVWDLVPDTVRAHVPFITDYAQQLGSSIKADNYQILDGRFRLLATELGPISLMGPEGASALRKALDVWCEKNGVKTITVFKVHDIVSGPSPAPVSIERQTPADIIADRSFVPIEVEMNALDQDGLPVKQKVGLLASSLSVEQVLRRQSTSLNLSEFINGLHYPTTVARWSNYYKNLKRSEQYKKAYRQYFNLNLPGKLRYEELPPPKPVLKPGQSSVVKAYRSFVEAHSVTRLEPTLQGKVSRLTTALESLKSNKINAQTRLDRVTSDLESYKANFESFHKEIDHLNALIKAKKQLLIDRKIAFDKYKTNEKAHRSAVATAQRKLDIANADYQKLDEELKAVVSNVATKDDPEKKNKAIEVYKNLLDSGLLITAIEFSKSNERPIKELIHDPDVELRLIEFQTTKPIVIRVDHHIDGDQAEKVAGGPYLFQATRIHGATKLRVRLATPNAILGMKKIEPTALNPFGSFTIHPHTRANELNVLSDHPDIQNRFVDFLTSHHDACLGEILPTLDRAIRDKDLVSIIYAIMSWASSAYSDDNWGEHWDWFPKVDEVNFPDDAPILQTSLAYKELIQNEIL